MPVAPVTNIRCVYLRVSIELIKLVLALKHLNIYFCSSRPKKTDLLFLRPWWSITYLVVHLIYFVALAWLR